MIRLMEWLLGRHRDAPEIDTTHLDNALAEATEQRAEARSFRRRAERDGPSIREELRKNHFGERMAEALEPRGYAG